MNAATFEIGTRFVPRGRKEKVEFTVIDILRTYNNAGELVRTRYVATRQLLGQTVTDHDVCATTIALGLIDAKAA